LLDKLRGGDGRRRGRPHPHDLQVGDPVDFWRVERVQPGRRLLLAAEMKMPGRLWLQFDVEAADRGTEVRQTTVFDPAGYAGLAYWYLLYPVHRAIFRATLRGLQRVTQSTVTGRLTAPAGRSRCHEDPRPHVQLHKVVDSGKDQLSAASSLVDPEHTPGASRRECAQGR
jgi:hypothetical protein